MCATAAATGFSTDRCCDQAPAEIATAKAESDLESNLDLRICVSGR